MENINDVRNPQDHDEHGKNCENIILVLIFSLFFKILAIDGTDTSGLCPLLVTE